MGAERGFLGWFVESTSISASFLECVKCVFFGCGECKTIFLVLKIRCVCVGWIFRCGVEEPLYLVLDFRCVRREILFLVGVCKTLFFVINFRCGRREVFCT